MSSSCHVAHVHRRGSAIENVPPRTWRRLRAQSVARLMNRHGSSSRATITVTAGPGSALRATLVGDRPCHSARGPSELRDDSHMGRTTSDVGGSGALRLLVDSNFYITLEPFAGQIETGQPAAAEVARLAAEQGHKLYVHPAIRDELLQAQDPTLRAQRLAELQKFPVLAEGKIPAALTDVLGTPSVKSNDYRDMRLLAALHQNAVAYLITDDIKLRSRAARVGLADRVLSLVDTVAMLRQLAPTTITPPPRVQRVEAYALDADEAIFTSLREDYDGFDQWLDTRVRSDPDNRDCLVIEEGGRYAGLVIVKRNEADCPYPFPQPVTKIATFKVDTDYLGSKYGELLLKSLFLAANDRRAATLYVEVLSKHDGLIELLSSFGFVDCGDRTIRGELVLVKHLRHPKEAMPLSALEYHIAYGPPAIRGTGKLFLVPIRPQWHRQLFPDAPSRPSQVDQLELVSEAAISTHPWGNALRKAYISNSPSQQLTPGDTLLFYRSRGASTVTAVGVVEETLRSPDAVEIMSFVGRRTVYTPQEIAQMCRRVRGVLAILFRQDRFVDPPWNLTELQANSVITAWPQSITQVRGGGVQWVHDQLAGQP